TRVIEETSYKQEIDELGTNFKGIDLIEVALSWNLAKEYQKLLEIIPGTLKQFTSSYLRRWDIQNVLNILRGKMQGSKTGKIKEILIPAGSLDRATLDRLVAEDSVDRIIDALKGHRMHLILAAHIIEAKETGSFSKMENELYRQFYADMIAEAESGIKGGKLFLSFIRFDIDIKNIKTLFRLRADTFEEDPSQMFIAGGALDLDTFVRLNTMKVLVEFVNTLKMFVREKTLLVFLDELKGDKKVHDVEMRLTTVQLDQMERMSKLHPFSIHPILAYLEKKKYEVFNLRALARGKESRLPADRILKYLVI
ncbi:MAG: V-type ATP synthase subunit C, partial [Methanoregula sp.]|nr:V-type ATP synthase subunit C [Methanoregula sp.]